MKIELVKYTKNYLNLSWNWLNDKEIQELTNTPKFTKQSQNDWFNGLVNRNDYKIWGIEVDGKPVGACGLKNINEKDCEYWGYIGEKDYWGKGVGSTVLSLVIEEARKKNLKSIWLKVLKMNIRAIKLYEKYGFTKIRNIDEKQIKMELIL